MTVKQSFFAIFFLEKGVLVKKRRKGVLGGGVGILLLRNEFEVGVWGGEKEWGGIARGGRGRGGEGLGMMVMMIAKQDFLKFWKEVSFIVSLYDYTGVLVFRKEKERKGKENWRGEFLNFFFFLRFMWKNDRFISCFSKNVGSHLLRRIHRGSRVKDWESHQDQMAG